MRNSESHISDEFSTIRLFQQIMCALLSKFEARIYHFYISIMSEG